MISRSRRSFLKKQVALTACMAAGLDVISSPARAANLQGYKALVCVYLAGGNDSFNMFVPASSSAYADYARARQFLAIPRSQLLPVSPVNYSDGLAYGFHPSMTESQRLFDSGQMAVVANVGTLINPVTKPEYEARSVPLPSQLFSHNDQTDSWLTSDASGLSGAGWAGRTIDIMYPNGAPQPSPAISIGGNTRWTAGERVRSFEVKPNGVSRRYAPYHKGPLKLRDTLRLMQDTAKQQNNLFVREHAMTLERAESFTESINTALDFAPQFSTQFPESSLSAQLQMAARLIAVRDRLDTNLNRQVFFVRIGGWDTHNGQAGQNYTLHAELLRQLDSALGAFNRVLIEMGVNESVTTFTATEFGRSLTPNGSGTDHGWGGHNLVMGGAVSGQDIYGRMPEISIDSNESVSNGRIIPSSSVDQYSATMARWFGLTSTELASVFPNLKNFRSGNMGFMS